MEGRPDCYDVRTHHELMLRTFDNTASIIQQIDAIRERLYTFHSEFESMMERSTGAPNQLVSGQPVVSPSLAYGGITLANDAPTYAENSS